MWHLLQCDLDGKLRRRGRIVIATELLKRARTKRPNGEETVNAINPHLLKLGELLAQFIVLGLQGVLVRGGALLRFLLLGVGMILLSLLRLLLFLLVGAAVTVLEKIERKGKR